MSQNNLVNNHDAYHAHVYFDEGSRDFAKTLYEQLQESFNFKVGRFHEKPVGPHTKWMFQVPFEASEFAGFVDWLESNRGELSVLIHALTGDDLVDHTQNAMWLGPSVELDLSLFKS